MSADITRLSNAKILSVSQFCALLGMSRYKLQNMYDTYQLPITRPYKRDGNGNTVKYSYDDVLKVRDYLAELRMSEK